MIVDYEALMEWAKEQSLWVRPIRLEISAEEIIDKPYSSWTQYTARAYLAYPGCKYMNHHNIGNKCECAPLAEKRLT
jgi:hypothetical protein